MIATDILGCREIFDEGISGISFKAQDGESLVDTIRRFIDLPHEEKYIWVLPAERKWSKNLTHKLLLHETLKE